MCISFICCSKKSRITPQGHLDKLVGLKPPSNAALQAEAKATMEAFAAAAIQRAVGKLAEKPPQMNTLKLDAIDVDLMNSQKGLKKYETIVIHMKPATNRLNINRNIQQIAENDSAPIPSTQKSKQIFASLTE